MIMRRPLDWFVVSISMMLLAANRMLASPPAESAAPTPELPVAASAISIPLMVASAPGEAALVENPFAYIREDGSLQFLPAASSRPMAAPRVSAKTLRSRPTTPSTALYSWSTPLILNDRGNPSFE
jgi:hypothetical protein